MKRFCFFMLAALFAVSSVFVSCGKDPEETDPPTIEVKVDGEDYDGAIDVKTGETLPIVFSWTAGAGVKSMDLKLTTSTGTASVDGYPKEDVTGLSGTVPITSQALDRAGQLKYQLSIIDEEDRPISSVEVVINVGETNLGDAVEFQFEYRSLNNTANILQLDDLGIIADWGPNLTPVVSNAFVLRANPPSSVTFVSLASKAEHDGILTKEALKAKFDAGTLPSSTFNLTLTDGQTLTAPAQMLYFIVKYGNDYFLVETLELHRNVNGSPPANSAKISYKQ